MANNRLTWRDVASQVDNYSDAGRLGVLATMGLGQALANTGKSFSDMHSEAAARNALQYLAQSWDPNNRQSFNEALPLALAANPGMSSEMLKYLTGAGRTLMDAQLDADNLAVEKEKAKLAQNAIDAAKANGDVSALRNANTAAKNLGLRPDAITYRSADDILNSQADRAAQYAAIATQRRTAEKELENEALQDNKAGALKTFLAMGGNQNLDPQTKANLMQRIASSYSTNNKEYIDILSHLADNSSKFGTTDYSRYFDPSAPLTITTYDPNNVLAGTTTRQVAPINPNEILTQFVPNSDQQTKEDRLNQAEQFKQTVNNIIQPKQNQTAVQDVPSTPPVYDPKDPLGSVERRKEWYKNRMQQQQNQEKAVEQEIDPTFAAAAQSLVGISNNIAQTDFTPQGQRNLTLATNNLSQAANTVRADINASMRAHLLNGIGSDVTPEIEEATIQYANAFNNKADEASLANIAAQYSTADGKPMSVSQLADLSPIEMLEQIEKYFQNKLGERVFTDSDRKDILEDLRNSTASTASPDMSDTQKATLKNLAIRNVIASTERRSFINPIGIYAERDFSPSQYKKMSAYTKKAATDSNSPFAKFAQVNQDIVYSEQQVQLATVEALKIYRELYDLTLREGALAREGRSLTIGEQAKIQELTKQLAQYNKLIQSHGQNLVQAIKQYK